jgi:hypothetical protein
MHMSSEELATVLAAHAAWLRDDPAGTRADLSHADLYGSDLVGAILRGADLSHADMHRAELSHADLSRADMRSIDLERAHLYMAKLVGAHLCDACLCDADLHSADLSGADLRDTCLMRAELGKANLSGADLRGADLPDANLDGVKLLEAHGIITLGPIGSRGAMLYVVAHEHCRMYQTGCFWGDEVAFLARVQNIHGGDEHGRAYRAAVELARLLLPVEVAKEEGE